MLDALVSNSGTGCLCAALPALVAQWIEQRFPKPCVAGSIPAGGTDVTSRDIVYTCLGTSLHVGERLGLVVAGGVQGEVPERFSVLGEDADVEVGHQDHHPRRP